MRVFIALPCPEEVKKNLAIVQEDLKKAGDFKMVDPVNIHLTLKFLGEVDEDLIDEIIELLEGVDMESFGVTVKGVGVFPNRRNPRVIWAGVEEGCGEVERLHEVVDEVLKEFFSIQPENRFQGHYTIARVKYVRDKTALNNLFDKYCDKEFGRYIVECIDLMQSRLRPDGPVYSLIYSKELCRR